MFIDPGAALPHDEIVARLWKRKPELYRQTCACAERLGLTVEEFVRQAEEEHAARFETDPAARTEFERTLHWKRLPFGEDPRHTPHS